jgi:hypothetical protein
MGEAVERGRSVGIPLALGWGLCDLAEVYHLRRDAAAARDSADEASPSPTRTDLPFSPHSPPLSGDGLG